MSMKLFVCFQLVRIVNDAIKGTFIYSAYLQVCMEKPVIVQIGKQGISDNIALDIKNFLKDKKPVTVRFLKSFLGSMDRKTATKELNGLVGRSGKLIGNTVKYALDSPRCGIAKKITRYSEKSVEKKA